MVKERYEQAAFVTWVRKRGGFIFSIPNGGQMSFAERKVAQQTGEMAGIPDLCFIKKGLVVWIEMKKRKGGVVSAAQKKVHTELNELNQPVIVAHGAAEARDKLIAIVGEI